MTGTWAVGFGSVVGYRVNEVLLGQNATAVGRTTSVTGHLTIAGTTATAASFSVPMATVHSDKSQRDAQLDGRAGASLVAASAMTRFGIFEAGMASARDPKYTIVPQRRRS